MRIILLFIAGLSLFSCKVSPIQGVFKTSAPYKKYIKSLSEADLDQTVLARKWIQAGERALNDSVLISLPFAESGYFESGSPDARAYRFSVKEGQVITVKAALVSADDPQLFIDLFHFQDSSWVPMAHSDSTLTLSYEFQQDDLCLLRIQPELLADVYYSVKINMTPVLLNPVAGAQNKSIGSFYGDPRDGGKRSHEGVDIFARKGTPVIAPVHGVVSRVGSSKLGGKVVWMRDHQRNHSYYFAHLDEQLVSVGMKLRQGDTLGTVGNTGNARFTPPHLHFGIYQRGSKDPINFLRTVEQITDVSPWDTTFSQPAFKVVAKQANFRSGPGEKEQRLGVLSRDHFIKVIAQSKNWFRVMLPDGRQGFVFKDLVSPIVTGKRAKVKAETSLLSEARINATPIENIKKGAGIQVLASFDIFKYVRTKEGQFGWLVM